MIQDYREDEGMDPGLGDLAYDGTEYELDEFGERVGSDDMFDDDEMEDASTGGDAATGDSAMAGSDMATSSEDDKKREDAFGETLTPDNPHLEEQLTDTKLSDEAQADYEKPATDGSQDMDMPEDKAA